MKRLFCQLMLVSIALCSFAACAPKENNLKLDPKEIAAEHAQEWEKDNKAGLAAMTSGDLDAAEKSLVAGLKEAEECGQEDVRVAVSLNNLASLYEKKKMYSQCSGYLQKARKIFRKTYGNMNESIPVTERNEARILTKQEKWAEAIPLYEEAIRYMEMLKSKDLDEVKTEYEEAKKHLTNSAPSSSAHPASPAHAGPTHPAHSAAGKKS